MTVYPEKLENIVSNIANADQRHISKKRLDALVKVTADIISEDHGFLEWAVKHEGLAETYMLYLLKGNQKDSEKNRAIIETWARERVSDNEEYISLITSFFGFEDMLNIEKRIIGNGKIGGKAAGMYIAYKALTQHYKPSKFEIKIPESWFIGSDVFADFIYGSGLDVYQYVKYFDQSYTERYEDFLKKLPFCNFSEEIKDKFRELLDANYGCPMIIRSSSLLEDGFGTPFAGKYDSYFIPNRFSSDENLSMFIDAVKAVYASVFSPNSLEYRKKKNLLKEYESMAVLVQKVIGDQLPSQRNYFLPSFSGVGFSQNAYPWSKNVKQEDGVVRIAMGLGTAVVDRAADTDGRICLYDLSIFSSPTIEKGLGDTQRKVHAINLEEKDFRNTVEKIGIYRLQDIHKIQGLGEMVEIEVADGYSQIMVPASEHTIDRGGLFITFPTVRSLWGKRFRKILKRIEFMYATGRGHLAQYLNKSKWVVVGNIMNMMQNTKGCYDDQEAADYMKALYGMLEKDELAEFSETMVRRFYRNNKKFATRIIGKFYFAIGARTLLENLGGYTMFKKALAGINNRKLREGVNKILARNAVDTEFAVMLNESKELDGTMYLLQCRPQAMYSITNLNRVINDIDNDRKFIDASWPCPNAQVEGIKNVIFVDDKKYSQLSEKQKYMLSNKVGELNKKYEDFILIIPGRAGSSHPELGVPVGYKDINNSKLLIEYPLEGKEPEFSYGSHFYLDLAGDNIFTFAVESGSIFKRELIYERMMESYFDNTLIVAEIHMTAYLSGIERRIVCELAKESAGSGSIHVTIRKDVVSIKENPLVM